jgi:hypothetical protein
MESMLDRFRPALLAKTGLPANDPSLLVEREGDLAMYYAPFDYVETRAKVVLVGITPGASQATTALDALRKALLQGLSDDEALRRAKATASFSGRMRANLVAMLDSIGLQRKLDVGSCSEVFAEDSDSVHFTSALRYPVFLKNKNYSGSPSISRSPLLESVCNRWLREEALALPKALWIALGPNPVAPLMRLVQYGILDARQVLVGMPHPSPANVERIAYFLGEKHRATLSRKTNPDQIDGARARLCELLHDRPNF